MAGKHGSTKYNLASANSFISMLLVAIGIGMFTPDFVPQAQWKMYSLFSICTMVVMYAGFLRLQTVEHRRFFEYSADTEQESHDEVHSPNKLHVAIMLGDHPGRPAVGSFIGTAGCRAFR